MVVRQTHPERQGFHYEHEQTSEEEVAAAVGAAEWIADREAAR
jgi:hypothetical protein